MSGSSFSNMNWTYLSNNILRQILCKKQTNNNLDLYVIHWVHRWKITLMSTTQEDTHKKAIGISYVLESCWFKNTNGQLSKQKKNTHTLRNVWFSIYYFDISMDRLSIIMAWCLFILFFMFFYYHIFVQINIKRLIPKMCIEKFVHFKFYGDFYGPERF